MVWGGGSMGLLANGTVIIASDHGFLNTTGTEISPGTSPARISFAADTIFLFFYFGADVARVGMLECRCPVERARRDRSRPQRLSAVAGLAGLLVRRLPHFHPPQRLLRAHFPLHLS